MLNYYKPFNYNSYTVSIDNVVLDTIVDSADSMDIIEAGINVFQGDRTDIISWKSSKPGTFRQQYSFRIGDGSSFWLGIGLIGNKLMSDRYRMEFNPNKVADHAIFKAVHSLLLHNCRQSDSRIARYDLAIDIPVERSLCFLVKDRRLYIERRHGAEFTQYLGAKSAAVGRVKLYNKAAEAALDYPLTRLELTLNPGTAYDDINFPLVYCIDNTSVSNAGIKVSDTDRFILNAILQGAGSLNDLGRKTRAKIETVMQQCTDKVQISPEVYAQMLRHLSSYLMAMQKT